MTDISRTGGSAADFHGGPGVGPVEPVVRTDNDKTPGPDWKTLQQVGDEPDKISGDVQTQQNQGGIDVDSIMSFPTSLQVQLGEKLNK